MALATIEVQGEILPPITQPWSRLPGEDSTWYDRFVYYYLPQYPPRSILGAYKRMLVETEEIDKDQTSDITTCPTPWYEYSKRYDWKERALAKDDRDRELYFADYDALRERVKQKRIQSLLITLDKTTKAIAEKSAESVREEPTAQLSTAQKNSARELREELDGHSPTTQINVLVADLSPDLRLALSDAIKHHSST